MESLSTTYIHKLNTTTTPNGLLISRLCRRRSNTAIPKLTIYMGFSNTNNFTLKLNLKLKKKSISTNFLLFPKHISLKLIKILF